MLFSRSSLPIVISFIWSIISASFCFADQLEKTTAMELVQDRSLGIIFQPASVFSQGVTDEERDLIEQFAAENQLEPKWIDVAEIWQLMAALIDGHGDIIVGQSKSLASGLSGQIKFTYSWGVARQQLVARANTTRINSPRDFSARQIALKKSSPSWPVLQKYLKQNPSMDLLVVPESSTQDEIMRQVISGMYDLGVVGSDYLKAHLLKYPNLGVVFNFSETESRAWAVRSAAPILQSRLDDFLNRNHLSMIVASNHLEDLPKIKERKFLRVITYPSPGNYFLKNGRMHGFSYEFIKKFADSEQLGIDVVLAHSHGHMHELLLSGGGDVIIAALPEDSFNDTNISMTVAYDYAVPVIVGRDSEQNLIDIRDLQGRKLVLPLESPYRSILEDLQHESIDFEIIDADVGINTAQSLYRVSYAMYDLSILGSQQLKTELKQQYGLKPLFSLSQPVAMSWAVRSSDYKLLLALNAYIEREYRDDTYNLLYDKYLSNPQDRQDQTSPTMQLSQLSPYDHLLKTNARKHNFDWRLIAAQMYQESQFDPHAVSYAGAKGLMQIMPQTADELGIDDLGDPVSNIMGGIKYMRILRAQFEQNLLLEDKTWLTLAAYNAGFNRVKDARILAEKMGLDSDRWFDHVEQAMLALAKPYVQQGQVKRVCNCGQTVIYVRNIRSLYRNYVRLTEIAQVANTRKSLRIMDI